MTQRLSTKIGAQGGLESNLESGQSQGFQVADNVVYRPIGSLSKRSGSKKLVDSKSGESKRVLLPTTTSVLSVQEVDSSGSGKILGYSKAGTRVDLHSFSGSRNVVLNPDVAFPPYDKLRLAFDDAVFQLASDFIEDAFARKLAALDGFWTPESSFTTVAVEQDSVDTDLLRVSTFANFPLLADEITITASASLSTPPDTTVRYDIIDWNSTYFTIYPTGGVPPAWTSTGDTGTINFSLKSLKVIEVDDTATSTESLTAQQITAHYEVEGEVPTDFSADAITLVSQDRSGEEIVFNSNLGQMWLSDENATSSPKVSYYGVPRAIDAVPFCYDVDDQQSAGALKIDFVYAYVAVFKKTINDQVFLGAPSPFFYVEGQGSFAAGSGSLSSGNLTFSGLTDYGDAVYLQLRNVVATPTIPDDTIFLARRVATNYVISSGEIQSKIGAVLSGYTSADVAFCPAGFVSCTVPQQLFEDYNRESGAYEYAVQIYRTIGVAAGSTPDISQFFLVKEQTFPTAPLDVPHVLAIDNLTSDSDLEFNLPLYTNVLEEGVLAANDLAPRYQNSVSKNGVFYLGDLSRKLSQADLIFTNFQSPPETLTPTIETSITEVQGFLLSPNLASYFNNRFSFSVTTGTLNKGFFIDGGSDLIRTLLLAGGVFSIVTRLDTLESFVAYRGALSSGEIYELFSLNGDINAANENKSVKAMVLPLWTGAVTCKIASFFFEDQDTYGSPLDDTRHTYALGYRALNLSPYSTPTFLSDAYPAATFRQASRWHLFYQENFGRQSGTFQIDRRLLEDYSSTFPAWANYLGSTTTFELESARSQIAYSKPFETGAFPSLNFLTVGSTDNVVYGLFLVRESILIASKEGFFRLTGDQAADFALTPIERDTVPLSPLLMAEQQDQVYAWTQKGIVAATESTVSIIDAPVQDITERFLSLYRDDLDTLSEKVIYTGRKPFLNALFFYLPSLTEKDTSKSAFGLMLDSSYRRFATVDLYTSDGEKYGVHSQSYSDLSELSDTYSTPSLAPSALYEERNATDRSDFAQDESVITLQTSWTATGSVTASSAVLTVTTGLDHQLQAGDYVKLVSGSGDLLTTGGLATGDFDGVHLVTVSSATIFQVTLPSSASAAASGDVIFRFGRQGLAGTLSLTAASATATLTFAADVDAGWAPGSKLRIQKPWSASLVAALSSTSDLEGEREVLTATAGSLTFALSAPASGSFSGSVTWSDGALREPFGKSFAVPSSSFSQDDLAVVTPFSDQVFFPFTLEKRTSSLTQGFLERTLPPQWAADRPARLYTSFPSTFVTARITGGDPCSLKSFEQIVVSLQSFMSCTKAKVAFQGDRYAATGAVTWVAQNLIDGPFDPAFSDVFWSALFSQWASVTSPSSGWKEAAPFAPMRLTVPTEVAQSTYLALILRHERPLETLALGSIAVNGTFIDPTSVGV